MADEAMAKGASTTDKGVAKGVPTADEAPAKCAAKCAATAGKGVATAVSTADESVAKGALTVDEVVVVGTPTVDRRGDPRQIGRTRPRLRLRCWATAGSPAPVATRRGWLMVANRRILGSTMSSARHRERHRLCPPSAKL